MTGLWGEVVATTSRIHRRKLFHEQRVTALLREFRRMASAMPDGVVLLGRNREILWFNAAAGRWLDLRRKLDRGMRIDNLVRHPAVVEYLEAPGGRSGAPRAAAGTGRSLARVPPRQQRRGRAAAAAGARRDERGAARCDAQGLRGQRVARTALAAHRDRRLPRRDGGRSVARLRLARTGQGDAPAVRSHARRSSQDLLELSRLEAQGGPAEKARWTWRACWPALRKEVLARAEPAATIELDVQADACLLGSETELHSVVLEPGLERGEVHAGRRAASVSAGGRRAGWPPERQGHRDRHRRRSTCRASPSASTAWTRAARASSAARASASRSSSTRCSGTTPGSRSRASEGKGSTFTCHFPVGQGRPDRALTDDGRARRTERVAADSSLRRHSDCNVPVTHHAYKGAQSNPRACVRCIAGRCSVVQLPLP